MGNNSKRVCTNDYRSPLAILPHRYRNMFMRIQLSSTNCKMEHPNVIKDNFTLSIYKKNVRKNHRKLRANILKGRNKQKQIAKMTLLRHNLIHDKINLS